MLTIIEIDSCGCRLVGLGRSLVGVLVEFGWCLGQHLGWQLGGVWIGIQGGDWVVFGLAFGWRLGWSLGGRLGWRLGGVWVSIWVGIGRSLGGVWI